MSTWTTKALSRTRNYIVLKHKLKGVNYTVHGVKFRDGFAVVEKDSKTYNMLKQMPILKNAQELPLTFLQQCKFITRILDIKIVYGQDVYRCFIEQLEKEQNSKYLEELVQKESAHLQTGGCSYRFKSNLLCEQQAVENSPSQYCQRHILEDTQLEALGVHVPRYIAKDEKEKIKNKIIRQLKDVKKVTNGEIFTDEQEAK